MQECNSPRNSQPEAHRDDEPGAADEPLPHVKKSCGGQRGRFLGVPPMYRAYSLIAYRASYAQNFSDSKLTLRFGQGIHAC
jgi:hypothetical protein